MALCLEVAAATADDLLEQPAAGQDPAKNYHGPFSIGDPGSGGIFVLAEPGCTAIFTIPQDRPVHRPAGGNCQYAIDRDFAGFFRVPADELCSAAAGALPDQRHGFSTGCAAAHAGGLFGKIAAGTAAKFRSDLPVCPALAVWVGGDAEIQYFVLPAGGYYPGDRQSVGGWHLCTAGHDHRAHGAGPQGGRNFRFLWSGGLAFVLAIGPVVCPIWA